jgi:hypothetical protein
MRASQHEVGNLTTGFNSDVTSSPQPLRSRCDGDHKKALYRAAGIAALRSALWPWTESGHRSIDRPVCRNGLFLWSVLAADRFDRIAARAGSARRLTLRIKVEMEVRRG